MSRAAVAVFGIIWAIAGVIDIGPECDELAASEGEERDQQNTDHFHGVSPSDKFHVR